MARVVKEEEYTARRNEILAAAQRFVYTKGYEQMTIQDILNDLKISKGAFYHYFNSKGDVLEALVERMVIDEMLPLILPIVEDPWLSAIEKLERYFDIALRWKTTQKSFMLAILRVWIADENAIVRQKILSMTLKQVTPLLTDIVRQGVEEGVFRTSYPEQVSHLIIQVLLGLGDSLIELIITSETNPDPVRTESAVSEYIFALRDAMERILGAPSGSLKLIEPEVLNQWFVPSEESRLSPEPNPG
jgi:AcrR family transcriptional regulator